MILGRQDHNLFHDMYVCVCGGVEWNWVLVYSSKLYPVTVYMFHFYEFNPGYESQNNNSKYKYIQGFFSSISPIVTVYYLKYMKYECRYHLDMNIQRE